MNKLLSLILALALTVCAFAGLSVNAGAEAEETYYVDMGNVEYGNYLHLALTIVAPAGSGIAVYASADAEDYLYATFTEKDDGAGTKYFATQEISAKDIDTTYYVAVVEKTDAGVNEISERKAVSVEMYANLALDSDKTDAQKALYRALIAYGEAADAVLEAAN